jgi:DNA-binding transcriptional regulator/RsmH inhibitor MraZ
MEERPISPASGTPEAAPPRLRAPLGFYPCKVDSAGRLKLPARYQDYLGKLPDQKLFVTEYQGLAKIFTNGSWEKTLARITDPALKRRFAFQAEAMGSEVDIDPQGRITLPQQLRKELGLEEKAVQLRFYEDVITIYPQEQFEEELNRVRQFRASDLERLAAMGIEI